MIVAIWVAVKLPTCSGDTSLGSLNTTFELAGSSIVPGLVDWVSVVGVEEPSDEPPELPPELPPPVTVHVCVTSVAAENDPLPA